MAYCILRYLNLLRGEKRRKNAQTLFHLNVLLIQQYFLTKEEKK